MQTAIYNFLNEISNNFSQIVFISLDTLCVYETFKEILALNNKRKKTQRNVTMFILAI